MNRTPRLAFFATVIALACTPEPGEVRLELVWKDPAPTIAGLWVYVSVEERPGDVTAKGTVVGGAEPKEYVPGTGATVEVASIPNGRDRVFVVEIRDRATLTGSKVVYRGLSERFEVSPGISLDVPVGLGLERSPMIAPEGGLSVEEANAAGEVSSAIVTLRIAATRAQRIIVGRDAGFVADRRALEAASLTVTSSAGARVTVYELAGYDLTADAPPCGSPGCSDGTKAIFAKVVDALGYESAVLTTEVLLDTTAPQLVAVDFTPSAAPDGAVDELMIVVDQPLADDPVLTWADRGDPGFELVETSRLSYTYRRIIDASVVDGRYSIASVELADPLGNRRTLDTTTSAALPSTLTVDRKAPTIGGLALSRPRIGRSGVLVASFTVDEDLEPDALEVTLGGASFDPCTSPDRRAYACRREISGDEISGDEGPATILVRATDPAGNFDSDDAVVVIDLRPPDLVQGSVGLALEPGPGSVVARVTALGVGGVAHVRFTLDEPTTPGSIQLSAVPALEGTFEEESASGRSHAFRYRVVEGDREGTHQISVVATDIAGNVSPARDLGPAHTFSIDVSAPRAPDIGTPDRVLYVRDFTAATPRFLVRGGAGAVDPGVSVRLYNGPSPDRNLVIGTGTADSAGGFGDVILAAERDALYLVAADSAGNRSETVEVKDVLSLWKPYPSSSGGGGGWRQYPAPLPQGGDAYRPISLGVRDPVRGSLLGLDTDAVIEWSRQSWHFYAWAGNAGPSGRDAHGIAFDPARDRLIVFGGLTFDPSYHSRTVDRTVWEWSPSRHEWTRGPTTEPARAGHVVWYDPTRGGVLMFGGFSRELTTGDPNVWNDRQVGTEVRRWDGAAWSAIDAGLVAPPPRTDASIAYDPARGEAVLFGGRDYSGHGPDSSVFAAGTALGDTWVLGTGGWSMIPAPPGASPAPRYGHAMTYDPARGRIVLFGGTVAGHAANDTWEWDGARRLWIPFTSALSPPTARTGHSMVYDPAREGLLVTGGSSDTSSYGLGVWVRSGTRWLPDFDTLPTPWNAYPTEHPDGAGDSFAMATDWSTRQVVIQGGRGARYATDYWSGTHYFANDMRSGTVRWTGEWSGSSYSSSGPGGRVDQAMGYDPDTGHLLLAGGRWDGENYSGSRPTVGFDTWEWDGAIWNERATSDEIRYAHAIAYDGVNSRMIAFGGNVPGPPPEDPGEESPDVPTDSMFAWDPGTLVWTPIDPVGPRPSPRAYHTMVRDSARDTIVLFGGCDAAGQPLGDLWEYDGRTNAWTMSTASGPKPSARCAHAMEYDPIRRLVVVATGRTGPVRVPDISYLDPEDYYWTDPYWYYDDSTRIVGDVWAWDGASWSEYGTVPARYGARLAFDPVAERMLLVGGRDEFGMVLALFPPFGRPPTADYEPPTNDLTLSPMYVLALERDSRRRAEVSATVDVPADEIVEVELTAHGGGVGSGDSAAGPGAAPAIAGADLAVWDTVCGAWAPAAHTPASASAPQPISFTSPSTVEARRWIDANRQLRFALWPEAGGSTVSFSDVVVTVRSRRGGGLTRGVSSEVRCQPRLEPDLLGSRVEAEPNDTLAQASDAGFFPAAVATLSGEIAAPADVDLWAFDVEPHASVVARTYASLDDPGAECTGDFDTELRLLDAAGTVLATGQDLVPGVSLCSAIDADPSAAAARDLAGGRYYLEVRHQSGAANIGPYFLDLSIQ